MRLDAYCHKQLGFGAIKEEASEGKSVVSFSVNADGENHPSDRDQLGAEEETKAVTKP